MTMISLRKSLEVGLLHDSKKDPWRTQQVHEEDPLSTESAPGKGTYPVNRHHMPMARSKPLARGQNRCFG